VAVIPKDIAAQDCYPLYLHCSLIAFSSQCMRFTIWVSSWICWCYGNIGLHLRFHL